MAKSEEELRSMITKGQDVKKLPWFNVEIEEVPEVAKSILEHYSKIPPGQVLDHVRSVRNRGLEVFPYPCIGSYRFLDMSIPQSPVYPEILERLKSGQKLLDVGCAIGQELRKLIYDGVPGENLYASDLRQDFFDLGYELFQDRSSLQSKFIPADVFDDNSELIKSLAGQIDIVNAASFFHLFNWDRQVLIGKQLIKLLQAQSGSLIIGRQVGSTDPVDLDDKENAPEHYRHNPQTWARLWNQIGDETGTKWEVTSRFEEWAGADKLMKHYHDGLDTYKLRFVVRRI